jgi:hypothetical protein
MKPADVTSALATRRTVRITYVRSTDSYSVDVTNGDDVDYERLGWAGVSEARAEEWAAIFARIYRLDISRVDVDHLVVDE